MFIYFVVDGELSFQAIINVNVCQSDRQSVMGTPKDTNMRLRKRAVTKIPPESMDCAVCQKLKSNQKNKKYCFECFNRMLKECEKCKLPFFYKCSFQLNNKICNKCFQRNLARIAKKFQSLPSTKKMKKKTLVPNSPLEGVVHCC